MSTDTSATPEAPIAGNTISQPVSPIEPVQAAQPVQPVSGPAKSGGKGIIILLGLLVLLLVAANVWYLVSNSTKNNGNQVTPTPTASPTAEVTVTNTAAPTGTSEATPTVTPLVYQDRLMVTAPRVGDSIPGDGGTVVLTGKMQGFFEGVMTYRFENSKGDVLYSGSITAAGDNYGQYANFAETVTLPAFAASKITDMATLSFFDVSMKDGTETKLITVPLVID